MNEIVEDAVKGEIIRLAQTLKDNPGAVLQIASAGGGWDLNKVSMPEEIPDKDVDKWVDENGIANINDYDMPSPDGFDFPCDILVQAMALALGLKMEPY